jgi:hypothetical protein
MFGSCPDIVEHPNSSISLDVKQPSCSPVSVQPVTVQELPDHAGRPGSPGFCRWRVGAPCCDVFELADGKIKRFDCYPEGSIILTQLGVIGNLSAALEH